MGLAAKVAKLAQLHPAMAKIFGIGLNAVRNGTVGTAQGLARGQTLGQALETGAIAAGTGAAFEGGAEGITPLAPTTRTIAREAIPVRASQDSTFAAGAEHAAPSKTLQQFNVEQTQPGASEPT
jgi:hypothetical protein